MALKEGVLVERLNGSLNLEIKRDFKVIIDYFNKKYNILSLIIMLI